MLFSSISLLFYFLPLIILVYYIVPKKFKNIILLIFSLGFYMYGEPKYIIVMIISILIAYVHGLLVNKYLEKDKQLSKMFLISSAIFALGFLIFFKYTNFFISNINTVFSSNFTILNLVLPIGISFYTFQSISYVADVYMGRAKVQKKLLKLAMYISLFPQLIAGPIVRYSLVENQLTERKHDFEKFSNGIRRFIIGLSKKILLANSLASLCVAFSSAEEKTTLFYWIYGFANAMYIYFDFSGYSDMAIGLGKMFGFEFLENFNYPFISKTNTEFWRRWHISLGSWFRDYVYIPLGGNRVNKLKFIRNIFIVWMLTGFWHGAEWTFLAWGLYFAIVLTIEKESKFHFPSFIQRILLIFSVIISFILFSATNITDAFKTVGGLFGINTSSFINNETVYYLKSYAVILVLGIFFSTPICKNIIQKLRENKILNSIINILEIIVLMTLLLVCTAYLIDSSFNPFLYFRF